MKKRKKGWAREGEEEVVVVGMEGGGASGGGGCFVHWGYFSKQCRLEAIGRLL